MRFLEPAQLFWGLTALLALALYLFRRRPVRVPVSSLLFFKALSREHQESSWLRWLKRLLSLLFTLLVIAGVTGALARLISAPAVDEVKTVVILLDRSASMAARQGGGPSRLEAVITQIRDRLAGVAAHVPVMLVAFSRETEILVPRTLDRRAVERALAQVQVQPVEGDPAPALRLASEVAALESPAAVWFASDAPAGAPEQAGIEHVDLLAALPGAVNVGLTALEVRPLPLEAGKFEAFVRVVATAPAPVEVKLEVRLDGVLTAVRELTIEPGGTEKLLLPVTSNTGSLLQLRVVTPGDSLAADDEVALRLPHVQPLRVLWISAQDAPFTQLALTALGQSRQLQIFAAKPEAWPPKETVDAVIFQGWLPGEWPTSWPVLAINPPSPLGPLQLAPIKDGGLPVEQVRTLREHHPLLYGVATGRLVLTQTSVLGAEGSLEPIWSGPSGPLLAAGEFRGARVAVWPFDPERSETLPLSASYPLLLGNALQWAAQTSPSTAGARPQRTGDAVAGSGKELKWLSADGSRIADRAPLYQGRALLNQVGQWRTDGGTSGSAALLSDRETLLPAGAAAADQPGTSPWFPRWRGDFTATLLWLVLAVLLLESWLFHRHAVH